MTENNIHILLVDDDESYSSIVKHRLTPFQSHQFELICEKEGDKAISTLKTNQTIDLVLMDYYLQNQTGLDVTKKIFEEKINVPILFLTSNKDLRAAVEAMKYGVEDYLIKEIGRAHV